MEGCAYSGAFLPQNRDPQESSIVTVLLSAVPDISVGVPEVEMDKQRPHTSIMLSSDFQSEPRHLTFGICVSFQGERLPLFWAGEGGGGEAPWAGHCASW